MAIQRTLTGLLCAALVGQAGGSTPVSIPINNPGFEANVVSPGCFQVLNVTDWDDYDPFGILNGGNNSVGGLNLPVGSVWFPDGAPEGEHAALIFLAQTIGAGPAGLTQVLGDTLQPNTRYTLRAQVGDIASGTGPPPCNVFGFFDLDNFPGYQVQLLAGGVVIAQDDNTLAPLLTDGTFLLSTTVVCIGDTHPQLGQPLEIRLINLNEAETPETPGIEVDFDDIQLLADFGLPLADLDNDCDSDSDDVQILLTCLNGADAPPSGTCPPGAPADIDLDGDIDMEDVSNFMLNS